MMKKLLALLLILLLPCAAMAEVDVLALQSTEGCMAYTASNGVDTVIRWTDQPFIGMTDVEDGELIAFLDYVDMPNEDAVFLRLTLSLVTPEMYAADTMTLTVGQKTYTFSVMPEISEYDTVYYEDYAVCLTEASLPILQDITKLGAKAEDAAALHEKYDLDGKPVLVTLSCEGEEPIHGSVVIPAENVKVIRDRYEEGGGLTQNLSRFDERWPVEVSK